MVFRGVKGNTKNPGFPNPSAQGKREKGGDFPPLKKPQGGMFPKNFGSILKGTPIF